MEEGAIEKQIARKWHIITLQEAIEYVDHELLTNRFHYGGRVVLFNIKTLSSLMSRSNPSTFTISGAYCQMRWLKGTQAWFYRACYHVPLFVDNLPAGKKHSQLCRCTSVTLKYETTSYVVITRGTDGVADETQENKNEPRSGTEIFSAFQEIRRERILRGRTIQ